MKDSSIVVAPTPVYNVKNQCHGKKAFRLKRRAINRAREYAETTGVPFTVYECPHCGCYHVGKVRVE